MGLETIALYSLISAAAATGGYSAYQSKKSGELAEKSAEEQADAAKKLQEDEDKAKQQGYMNILKSKTSPSTNTARSTILTSPIGLTGGTAGGKTLLGQ